MFLEFLLIIFPSLSRYQSKTPSQDDVDKAKSTERSFKVHRFGVWEIAILSDKPILTRLLELRVISRDNVVKYLQTYFQFLPHIIRFYTEIYHLAPNYFVLYAIRNLWDSLESGLSLYYTSRLLEVIGDRVQGKDVSRSDIIWAILWRFLCTLTSNVISRLMLQSEEIFKDRIKYHFVLKSMRVSLNLDLASADDPEIKDKLGEHWTMQYDERAWQAFDGLSRMVFSVASVFSQALMVFALLRKNLSDPIFLTACVVVPLLNYFVDSSELYELWNKAYVTYCIEPAYMRMAALYSLAYSDTHRSDRLSDGVGEYIEKEFIKQRNLLGDKCTDSAINQFSSRASILARTVSQVSPDFPLIIFGIKTLFNVNNLNVTSLTVLQQTAQTISWTVTTVRWEFQGLSRSLTTVRNIYAAETMFNKFVDGELEYPPADVKHAGAEVEFKDVTFAYPGEKKNAIEGVSFKIKPGQMVVIVGVNGSGKSSTIKLFNRLYNPTSGTILLDGKPLQDYRVADVRRCMAVLRQDHTPYPISLRENIALGLPERRVDVETTDEELESAADKGGALSFIKKLDKGMDTVLYPVKTSDTHFPGETVDDLKALVEGREKTTDISGGESQRLAASRTFMRLSGGNIRFLAADEPTSALDPEGEFELFSKLRAHRGGKTVVFITHRFGHLTRFADLILCMKDGKLVEQGTHNELIEKGGEYYKLHNVQAQAFLPN